MIQAYMPEPGRILYREVEKPKPGRHEVLIRVARIGICGSDVHVFKGKHPLVGYPLVQGHEFSGTVEEVGEGVRDLTRGELVTVEPAIGCGTCEKCLAGLFAQCEGLHFIGGDLEGAGSEFFKIDQKYVVKLPPGVSADDAAMVEPLAVAVHAVRRVTDIQNRVVLIIGAGTIGNLTAQVARSEGAGKIILVDRIPFRNRLAERLGFTVIDPKEGASLAEEVVKRLGNDKPTIAFECVGSDGPLESCIRSVSRGGTIIVVGVYEEPPQVPMALVQDKEINLVGSLMYTWSDYEQAVALIAAGKVELKPLQTHHFHFSQWIEGYKLLLENPENAMKVLIDV